MNEPMLYRELRALVEQRLHAVRLAHLTGRKRFVRSSGSSAFVVGLRRDPALVRRLQMTPAFHEVRTVEDDGGPVRCGARFWRLISVVPV